MLTLRSVPLEDVPWEDLDAFEDRVIQQRKPWLDFLAETQKGSLVVAEVLDGNEVAGYFTGVVVRKLGMRILGSSFPGWATMYMGFNLRPGYARADALRALERWAFDEIRCLHFEVSDRLFKPDDAPHLQTESHPTYVSDLRSAEDDLFGAMSSSCRRCIRKASKSGVIIEEAHDGEAFAVEYYEQLKDVFAKQRMVPTYPLDTVQALIRHLHPTGDLLLLRARSPDGTCIATGIYPGFGKVAQFWGNASLRPHQHLRPNEALHWHAMRYWKGRGIETFDWGGEGTYKEKYGVTPVQIPWFYKSKYGLLSAGRNRARQLYFDVRLTLRRFRRGQGRDPKSGEPSATT